MTVVAKARSSPIATSRRRSALGRLSMGAVLTTWLLDALGLSASVAWRFLGSRSGQVARSCGGEVGLGLAGVGAADHRVGVRARRTSVVDQARGREGSAGVDRRGRRRVGPTAPVSLWGSRSRSVPVTCDDRRRCSKHPLTWSKHPLTWIEASTRTTRHRRVPATHGPATAPGNCETRAHCPLSAEPA
jgi:hypothetical protein